MRTLPMRAPGAPGLPRTTSVPTSSLRSAAPTWRETPGALERLVRGAKLGAPVDTEEWRAAAAAVRARLSPEAFEEWDARLSIARAAVAVAEDDDALYARL